MIISIFNLQKLKHLGVSNQGCRKRGAGGALAPQFLAEQLTLSQPGGQIMPTTVLWALPDFQTLRRACSMY